MRRLLVLLLALTMMGSCALAQGQWTGPVLVGSLPEDARLIESVSFDGGYIKTLLALDGYIEITLACFPDEQARADYLTAFRPEMEPDIIEDDYLVAGCEALHTRYMAVKDGYEGTDDVSLAEHLGFKVKLVDCGTENIKLTYPEDEIRMKQILELRKQKGSAEI
jgi:hypothetical protein